jgi:F-type H+-transporting ATPase subunit gamma
MPTLKQIRRRINSTKSTQKITRAMKLVAGAKLRRAQMNREKAMPYAKRLVDLIYDLSRHCEREAHPLLAVRDEKRVLLIVVTSDRGLCGAFNANINRAAERFLRENKDKDVNLALIGKKGRDYFRRRSYPIEGEYMGILAEPSLDRVAEVGREVIAHYVDEGLDACYIVYNEFKSAVAQQVVIEKLLPIVPEGEEDESAKRFAEFEYEPSRDAILNVILPMYVNVRLWFAVLESLAAEMAARMNAMENATKNAEELIRLLTLQYNKARQAAITKEMLEIVSGAEAMK